MKVCPNCNTQVQDNVNACPNCGAFFAQPTNANNFAYNAAPAAPAVKLQTNRSLLKFILLSLITFGIYGIVVMCKVSEDINIIASKYDGKKTMHYLIATLLLSAITLGIVPIVWYHKLSARIGTELQRRNIGFSFGAGSFWGWCVLGILIVVGPLVYTHKLLKAMNLLSEDYNVNG